VRAARAPIFIGPQAGGRATLLSIAPRSAAWRRTGLIRPPHRSGARSMSIALCKTVLSTVPPFTRAPCY